MSIEAVEFQSENNLLHGKIDLVDQNAPFVIFLPGISGKALTDRFDYLGQAFNRAGFNFFRFNFRGHEENKSVDDSTLEEELSDFKNVITYLESQGYNLSRFGIISKSFGNLKTFLIKDQRLSCMGLLAPAVFFGTPSNLDDLKDRPYGKIAHISDILLDESILENWKVPTIIIHGDQDKIIDINNSRHIFDKLSAKKELKVIPGAGHSLDEEEHTRVTVTDYLIHFFKENFPSLQ